MSVELLVVLELTISKKRLVFFMLRVNNL